MATAPVGAILHLPSVSRDGHCPRSPRRWLAGSGSPPGIPLPSGTAFHHHHLGDPDGHGWRQHRGSPLQCGPLEPAGVFVTPLWVAWLMKASNQQQPLGPVIAEIVTLLLIPLVLGQLLRPVCEAWANRQKKRLGILSSAVVLFIVYAAFCNSVKQRLWTQHGERIAAGGGRVLLLFALAVLLTEVLARALSLTRPDLIAARCCAPQRPSPREFPWRRSFLSAPRAGAHPPARAPLPPAATHRVRRLSQPLGSPVGAT